MGKRSSPRGGDDSRGQSTSRRSSGEQGGKKEQSSTSLLVRNIPHDCSNDLLAAFRKFGRIRDFYIPKDHYSGEPRGFAFIEFWDSRDASEAQRHMHHKMLCGREINVVPATAKRNGPTTCVDELESEVILIIKGAIFLAMDGPVLVRTPALLAAVVVIDHGHILLPQDGPVLVRTPALLAAVVVIDHGHILLPQEGVATTLLHQRERKSARQNHQDSQKSMTRVRSRNRVLLVAEVTAMMLIMVPTGGGQRLTILPHQREWKSTRRNHQGRQKNMMRIRGRDLIPPLIEMTVGKLAMVTMNDYSTSPKRKEECLAKSPRLSKEHDKDKKRRSYSRDDGNDCCDADIGLKERRATTDGEGSCPRQRSPRPSSGSHSRRRDDYSASPKGKEEHQEQSPRHSKEYGKYKKRRSDTLDNRNDRRDADHSLNEIQDDHPTSPKIKEERQSKSSGESKEYDKDTKRRSYAPHDRNDRCDADNGSKDSNVHVDRKPVTPDCEGSHAGQRSPRPSTRSSSRRQDDYSASAKRKEELHAKSPKQSNEHDDKKRRSYTPDDRNDRCDADNCNKEKQDDYSASPKRKEECRAKSPRQTKEHEVKRISYAPDDRTVRPEADNGYNERRASPDNGSPKRTEEPRQTKSQSQSSEHDNDKNQRSTRDDRKDRCNADNASKERNDHSTSRNKKEERGENFPRQSKEHDENKKRGSFTPDDRNDHHDTDNGSKERDDNSASRKRMEDHLAKSPRQSKEHENDKKMGSYTHGDRNDHHDTDNGSKKKLATPDGEGSHPCPRQRSPRPSSGARSR